MEAPGGDKAAATVQEADKMKEPTKNPSKPAGLGLGGPSLPARSSAASKKPSLTSAAAASSNGHSHGEAAGNGDAAPQSGAYRSSSSSSSRAPDAGNAGSSSSSGKPGADGQPGAGAATSGGSGSSAFMPSLPPRQGELVAWTGAHKNMLARQAGMVIVWILMAERVGAVV